MIESPTQPGSVTGAHRESLWLVALYETEERIHELLERLHALGVETEDASIVHVELNDQLRAANLPPAAHTPLSPHARNAVTGAIAGSALFLLMGLGLYEAGPLKFSQLQGLPAHAVLFVLAGALLGSMTGALLSTTMNAFAAAQAKPLPKAATDKMQELASDGYLVAVKMPPHLGEQAEAIARQLGAKQILL
ncbi:MAG: hypothetical protein HYR56_12955 [Acidobacteria bacterium]|nr:hypothetical protein [Acidobacteriota bacterium]MBI3427047.1 hypothetical protein [Acidobacteriota bacterium]